MGRPDVGGDAVHRHAVLAGRAAEIRGQRGQVRRAAIVFKAALVAALVLAPLAVRPAAHDPITTKVTFTREISAILAARCVTCHSPRGFGAFANDPTLTPLESALIVSWVDGGLPEGTAARTPPRRQAIAFKRKS